MTPARPRPGRRARRKAETRARILRAALDLFARQGFFATTIGQITEAADVGKGTFFNYFPSKEHALAGFGDIQYAKVQAAVARTRRESTPIEVVLRDLLYALAEEPGRSPALVRSLLTANLSSQPVRALVRRKLARGRRALARLLADGQQRGEVRRDCDLAQVARLFQQTFFGALLFWTMHPSSRLTDWLDPAFDLLWTTVAAVPGGGSSSKKRGAQK